MPKTVTLRLDDETYEAFKGAAAAQNRSIANWIETAAQQQLREQQFVDEAEMAEILANEDLVRRLKEGSQAAAERKGRFVRAS